MQSSVALFCLPCTFRRCLPHFTGLHRRVLLWFYAVFAALTFLLMLPGAVSGHGEPLGTGVAAAMLAVSGPFTGILARDHWDCSGCHSFTMLILPYCGAALAGAFLFQFTPLPPMKFERPVRILTWVLGLLGWFAGTVLSVLVANS